MGIFSKGSRKKKSVSDRMGAAAALFLASTSLAICIYHVLILVPLLESGMRTGAEITGFHSGYRGTKWAIYQYQTSSGELITQRDQFPMYFIRPHQGERLTVIHDPDNPGIVTADYGIWVWQGPGIFLFGFLFLSTLGVLIFRYRTKLPPQR